MKKIALMLLAATVLTGCGPQSQDQFGVYADGENVFVVNHAAGRIAYGHGVSAPDLLTQTQAGQGLSFTSWRNATSCGLTDSAGNVFAIPRGDRFDKANAIFSVEKDPAVFEEVNGGPLGSRIVTLRTDNLVRIRYLYDDAAGIRWIDQYNPQGAFDRRLWLERGVGLLAHCRGFSFDDFQD